MIRLLLDEDVPEAIAVALRLRGYNQNKEYFSRTTLPTL